MATLHVKPKYPRECRVTNPDTGEVFYGLAVEMTGDGAYRVHVQRWEMPREMVARLAAEKPDFTHIAVYVPAKDISFDDVYLT